MDPRQPDRCPWCGGPGPFRLISVNGAPAWYHDSDGGCFGSFAATDRPIPSSAGGRYETETQFGTKTWD